MIDVLLAAPSQESEDLLVASAPAAGVHIVRRCIDAVDVLAAVATYPDAIPIISASLPRLVSATVERLGSRTVGLADDDEDVRRLTGLGVMRIVRSSQVPLWPALVAPSPADATIAQQPVGVPESGSAVEVSLAPASGAGVIAVWGPPGAPGRTTIAIGLADALARRGIRVCLVDADTYAPSIDLALGLGSGGLVTACLRSESASGPLMSTCCSAISSNLSVLPGVGPSQTWRDLRPSSLVAMWVLMRSEFDAIVVDIGSCIEDDDAGSPWAMRRNAAAVTALQEADLVLAVADGSPAGAARLAREWPKITTAASTARRLVVQNRAPRRSSSWLETTASLGIDAPILSIPHDPRGMASCWERAALPSEKAPRSPATRAMRNLASAVVPD